MLWQGASQNPKSLTMPVVSPESPLCWVAQAWLTVQLCIGLRMRLPECGVTARSCLTLVLLGACEKGPVAGCTHAKALTLGSMPSAPC